MSDSRHKKCTKLLATMVGVPACAISSIQMQAQNGHTASAKLEIAVVVVPTINFPQRPEPRGSSIAPASIMYNLHQTGTVQPTYSQRDVLIKESTRQEKGILKTTTLVVE